MDLKLKGVFLILLESYLNGTKKEYSETKNNLEKLYKYYIVQNKIDEFNKLLGIEELALQKFDVDKIVDYSIKKNIRSSKSLYIGIVGRNNSGKGSITEYLKEKYDFIGEAFSERVKEVCAAYGYAPPFDRKLLIDIGRLYKEKYGHGAFLRADLVEYKKINKNYSERFLFEGIRSSPEAQELKDFQSTHVKSILIAVSTGEEKDKDQRIRYSRALKRHTYKDPQNDTVEEFGKFAKLDDDEGEEIDISMSLADFTVINKDDDFESTKKQLDKIIKTYL
jgi:hypothetical protein